jgi:hypothetical protein
MAKKTKGKNTVKDVLEWADAQDNKKKMAEPAEPEFTHQVSNHPPATFTNTLPEMTHKADITAKSFDTKEVDKGGRPPKYQALFNNAAKKACSLGATDMDLSELFGVEETTIYAWKKKYKRFSKAIEAGKAMIDTMVERSLLNRALGCSVKETKVFCSEGSIVTEEVDKYFPPDVAAQKHWLNNRKPKDWRDKREVDFTSPLSIVMDEADQKTL